jgi:hypothetical protein
VALSHRRSTWRKSSPELWDDGLNPVNGAVSLRETLLLRSRRSRTPLASPLRQVVYRIPSVLTVSLFLLLLLLALLVSRFRPAW